MIVDELSTVILLLLVTFNQFLLLGIAVKPPALESVFCLKSEEVFASSFTSLLACKVEFLISISLVWFKLLVKYNPLSAINPPPLPI